MKKFFGKVRDGVKRCGKAIMAGVGVVGASIMSGGVAHAVLDAEETAVFTGLTSKIADLKAEALPLLGIILVAFIGFKLLKRFAYKAT
jgi:hypothetical protein